MPYFIGFKEKGRIKTLVFTKLKKRKEKEILYSINKLIKVAVRKKSE
jgi:hypothetical protein